MSDIDSNTTHFGFQQVPLNEKVKKVTAVFDSVASRYDIMNDLMSLGIHRFWKAFAMQMSGVREGHRVLDLASGTGDLAARLVREVGASGLVVASDINRNMLGVGRERLTDKGIVGTVQYVQANAEYLPFAENFFDCVTIAFGLRNVTRKEQALAAIYKVLKPGGRILVLEFSQPNAPGLKPVYDWYSFKMLPFLGKLVARDAESYRYLAESIRMHPDQDALLAMMGNAGFEQVDYFNLTGGIVALHRGYKV